eukprot:258610_1
MLTEPLMAGAHENYHGAIVPNETSDDDHDEKASLKSAGGNTNYKPSTNDQINEATPLKPKHSDLDAISPQASVPSLTRRMSSQFVIQVERQRSVVDNLGLTDKMNQMVPDAITQHIPGLARRQSQLKPTYFCNICFTKNCIDEGFTLRLCQHQFCPECIEGYMNNKINNGVVDLTCFHPSEGEKPCKEKIDEQDIHQAVSAEVWQKYEKFKANLSNTYSRQCPKCETTQNGDPNHPMMTCACGVVYCLYHSNAHDVEMSCEEYELSIAKETKMCQMAINESGENKECPQCKIIIVKSGGCNHMRCLKCNCSFCWLCMQIIDDVELPLHYKDENSPCKGKQFEGMEGEPPPRWMMALLLICIVIFCIPSTVLGIAFGCLCFPLVCCLGCSNENGERQTLWETMFGCWLIWLLIFIVIAVFIPLMILYVIWEVVKAIYGVIRLCCPCLPACPQRNVQPQQVGGAQDQNNNNANQGNQGLLSDNNLQV